MQNLEFNASNFFSRLIFHPNEGKDEKDRLEAWIATIALGILTVGIVHLTCGIYQLGSYLHDKWIEKKNSENLNQLDKNTQDVARNILEEQQNPTLPVEKPVVVVEEEQDIKLLIEETKRGQQQPDPIFSVTCSKEWVEKTKPDLERFMQKLPRAYFCIEFWGAARKMELTSLEGLENKFKKDDSFEKLPVVVIVFRNSNSEIVLPYEIKRIRNDGNEKSDDNELNFCCAVTMHTYGNKIIEGEGYEKAIAQITAACDEWNRKNNPPITDENF